MTTLSAPRWIPLDALVERVPDADNHHKRVSRIRQEILRRRPSSGMPARIGKAGVGRLSTPLSQTGATRLPSGMGLAEPPPLLAAAGRLAGAPPGGELNVDLIAKHIEKGQHLLERLRVVGRVQKPIELCRRGPEPASDLASRQR